MRLKLLAVAWFIAFLASCGLGTDNSISQGGFSPGVIQGKVLGGLYSGGIVSVYTLNKHQSRQFIASSEIQKNGDFVLEFSALSKPVLVEVRAGKYLDPVSQKMLDAEPDFTLSKTIVFRSGETQSIVITPFTHLAAGLALYKLDSSKSDLGEIDIALINKEIDDLFLINSQTQNLLFSLQKDQNSILLEGDERHGLLIKALAQLANDESIKRNDVLQSLYSLSSLTAVIYEDIRSDGKLDGKSIYFEGGRVKPLAFGDLKISSEFYRLDLALAAKKSLKNTEFSQFKEKSEQDSFIFLLAESNSGLLDDSNGGGVNAIVPQIKLISNLAPIQQGEFSIDFNVENALKLQSVQLTIDNLEIQNYSETSDEVFKVLVNSENFIDGDHSLGIVVNDSYGNTSSLQLPIKFDNSAPMIEVHSAKLSRFSDFTLEGSFSDELSNIKKIAINGQQAIISSDKKWSKAVTLSSGANDFSIEIQDILENTRKTQTQVILDNTVAQITFTSASLTNKTLYTLHGEYFDALTAVTKINVNGEAANILSENKWSIAVNLVSGTNQFKVGAEDQAGNYAEYVTKVELDKLAPDVTVSSPAVTNESNFLLQGEYSDAIAAVKEITFNGKVATIANNHKWSGLVTLNNGNNEFVIGVTDEVGNYAEFSTQVVLLTATPAISVTSVSLTNKSAFTLEGAYEGLQSFIAKITVNGNEATLMSDQKWFHPLTLVSGNNNFIIGVEDQAGNYSEITTQVVLDDQAPLITFTSASTTNTSDFLLQGEYIDEISGVKEILVNEDLATVVDDNTWIKAVTLNNGNNEFLIGAIDKAGNYAEYSVNVVLDLSAPVVSVTSLPLTNKSNFILEGEYEGSLSSISKISVNGNIASITSDQKWTYPVVLLSGNNDFTIQIENTAGTSNELTTRVILDNESPGVVLSSKILTNQNPFVLQGTYSDNLSSIAGILINGEAAQLNAGKTWSRAVSLKSGKNVFAIKITDKAGNFSELIKEIVLDELPPKIYFVDNVQSRFSNNDGSFYLDTMELQNQVPLYIESNQLSLAGIEVSKESLSNAKIPYFAFNVNDQPLAGFETASDKLAIEYRYSINNSEIIKWQSTSLEKTSNQLILPVVSETLSNAWYKVDANAAHRLEVRVTDSAGNVTTQQATFKSQFYVPNVDIATIDNLESIASGNFDSRANYVNKELVGINYKLQNSTGRAYRIKISDDSVHSVVQEYEEVRRENKVQLRSQESWRRSSITALELKCPQRNNDWQGTSQLWNRLNSDWVKIYPQIKKLDIISITTDASPAAPASTNWDDFNAADQEVYSYSSPPTYGEILSYDFDYIFNYDVDGAFTAYSQPGLVKSWSKKLSNGQVTNCPDVHAVQSKKAFDYLAVDGYPRNNLTAKQKTAEFYTSWFQVLDQDQSEIIASNGWYVIPAGHSVTIRKYVLTPDLKLYTDNSVKNSQSITDYNLHQLDKALRWSISQSLTIDTQFNPDGILDSNVNLKHQKLVKDKKSVVFQR